MGAPEINQMKQALIRQGVQSFKLEGMNEEQLRKMCDEKLSYSLTGNRNWENTDEFDGQYHYNWIYTLPNGEKIKVAKVAISTLPSGRKIEIFVDIAGNQYFQYRAADNKIIKEDYFKKQEKMFLGENFKFIDNKLYKTNLMGFLSMVMDDKPEKTELIKKHEVKKETNEICIKTPKNWSESSNRKVSIIYLPKFNENLYSELETIGKELGIIITTINSDDEYNNLGTPWFEDYGIRRHDGKMLIISDKSIKKSASVNYKELYGKDVSPSMDPEGVAIIKNSTIAKDFILTDCYLEGGNVLNTINAKGEPAAIIGDDAITLTLGVLGLKDTPANIKIIKNKIANDLGLKSQNVTYIPQHIFHIDMAYRPVGNGKVAIPDYESAILFINNELKKLPNTAINEEKISKLKKYKEDLIKISNNSNKKIMLAENELKKSGYKIIKIPCFTTSDTSTANHMNGIMGTTKNGTKFYITNKSDVSDFDKLIESILKKQGINKIYFVNTYYSLQCKGGIDCLTQED